MEQPTNIKKEDLKKEFDNLGLLALDYHNRVLAYCRLSDVDRAEYYLNEARKCLIRRDEILTTLYGQGTGIAI